MIDTSVITFCVRRFALGLVATQDTLVVTQDTLADIRDVLVIMLVMDVTPERDITDVTPADIVVTPVDTVVTPVDTVVTPVDTVVMLVDTVVILVDMVVILVDTVIGRRTLCAGTDTITTATSLVFATLCRTTLTNAICGNCRLRTRRARLDLAVASCTASVAC